MKSKPGFVRLLQIIKAITLFILTLLSVVLFIMLITDQEALEAMQEHPRFLVLSILVWISLIVAFSSFAFDFIVMKRHYDVTRDLDELAFLDKLTGLPNRFSVDHMSEKYNTREKMIHLGCVLLMINDLETINNEKGRETGDRIISDFCTILESVGHKYGMVGRNSGNEFLVVIEDCDRNIIELFLGDLQRRIHNHNTISPEYTIEVSYVGELSDNIMADRFYTLVTDVYHNFEEKAQTLY